MDNNGDLYVSDTDKDEIQQWKRGEINGTIIAGDNGSTRQKSNQFDTLRGLSFDRQGNFYVVDLMNNQVQKFEIDIS